jgi:hypothetical protein
MPLDTILKQSDGVTSVSATSPLHVTFPNEDSGFTQKVSFTNNNFMLDSFERLRVSEPRIAFEYSFNAMLPSTATTIWETVAYNSGTEELTTNLYGTNLKTTASAGSGRVIQSINHVRYAPAISTLMRFTFNLNNPTASGLVQRVGMFTNQGSYPSTVGDGLYFENEAGAFAFVRRFMTQGATGSEERVLRSNWNMDKLDGTGKSGVTLDFTKAQHLLIEFQFLGVGTIRFGFETGEKGVVWCHEMVSVNALAESWARTGSLPIRAECYNFAASTINTLTLINVAVLQEGDIHQKRGWRYFGATSGGAAKVTGLTSNTWYPIMGIRAAGTNDLTKRARIIPTSLTVTLSTVATGATAIMVGLMLLGTPNTGATFAVAPSGGSAAVIDIAASSTTAITGSIMFNSVIPNVVGSYTFDLNQQTENANVIGPSMTGVQAITGSGNLIVVAGPVQAASVGPSIVAALNWKEIV